MNIQLISDCHLNFGDLVLPGGDLLIMAGDIFEASDYRKVSSLAARYDRFCDQELTKYSKVLYVFGNHEHYGGDYGKTSSILADHLPTHVTFLENSYVELEGIRFWGATMWTDMNRNNPLAINAAHSGLNDFSTIKWKRKVTQPTGHSYWTSDFSPQATSEIHKTSLRSLKTSLEDKIPHFVITHHAPTHMSIDPVYSTSNLNHCYYSDLSDTILDHPHITTWVHGHTHNQSDYLIGTTRVVCNPRGYHGYESSANHYTPLTIN
jgi:Icc-related predicted phosphoesterase